MYLYPTCISPPGSQALPSQCSHCGEGQAVRLASIIDNIISLEQTMHSSLYDYIIDVGLIATSHVSLITSFQPPLVFLHT